MDFLLGRMEGERIICPMRKEGNRLNGTGALAGEQVVESTQSAVASLGFLEILDMRSASKSKISG